MNGSQNRNQQEKQENSQEGERRWLSHLFFSVLILFFVKILCHLGPQDCIRIGITKQITN